MYQMVSSFAQNRWLSMLLRVKAKVLQVACKAPTFSPDPSASLPWGHSALALLASSQVPLPQGLSPDCSLCLESQSPRSSRVDKPLPSPSSELGLNVTFSITSSQTACFLSPGSSFLSLTLTD